MEVNFLAIEVICGLVGKGKSYRLTKTVYEYQKKKQDWTIFSNVPIPNAKKLTKQMLEDCVEFPERSLLIIDEANAWFPSRRYKDLDQNVIDFFHYHRHLKIDIILVTQIPMRLDVVIRDLCDKWYWSRAIKIPSKKYHDGKALLFFYDSYLLHEDFGDSDKRSSRSFVIPQQKVFNYYSTYLDSIRDGRKKIEYEDWDNGVPVPLTFRENVLLKFENFYFLIKNKLKGVFDSV